MITNETIFNMLNSPARSIQGRVDAYSKSGTLSFISEGEGSLKSFTITRASENSKFFGFGVYQEIDINIIDTNRTINVPSDGYFMARMGTQNQFVHTFPRFYVKDVSRDEKTNELRVKAADALSFLTDYTVADIGYPLATLTYSTLGAAIATKISKATVKFLNFGTDTTIYNTALDASQINLSGNETLKELADAIAEATQSIYYITTDNFLVFKRLSKSGASVLSVTKDKYFDLNTRNAAKITKLIHATDLGDNLETGDLTGVTQVIRNNPFWTLLPSTTIAEKLAAALTVVGNTSITPFDTEWRGNFLLEPGDRIDVRTREGGVKYTYYLNDKLDFTGALVSTMNWEHKESGATSAAPITIGDKLNHTTAQVDKVRQEITLTAEKAEANTSLISSLQVSTGGITTKVEKIEKTTDQLLTDTSEQIAALRTEIQQTEKDLKILINEEISTEATEITTTTGFTFNQDGLTIDKSGSEIKTQITEDGMAVYKSNEEVLTADNQGVNATNLHARTYLIINGNSRFENYESPFDGSVRTGCFWIGG